MLFSLKKKQKQKQKTCMYVRMWSAVVMTGDLTLACWVILHAFVVHGCFFKITFFSKNLHSRNTIRVSESLDPDQAQRFVRPDLGPKLSAKIISRRQKSPLAGKELSILKDLTKHDPIHGKNNLTTNTCTILYIAYIYTELTSCRS